jgi:hypothetical protein
MEDRLMDTILPLAAQYGWEIHEGMPWVTFRQVGGWVELRVWRRGQNPDSWRGEISFIGCMQVTNNIIWEIKQTHSKVTAREGLAQLNTGNRPLEPPEGN